MLLCSRFTTYCGVWFLGFAQTRLADPAAMHMSDATPELTVALLD